jgi:hypothetical protein
MITEKIIGYLKRKFPDKSPDLTDNEKEIWFKAGQVSVVRHLEGLLKEQETNVLNIQDLEEL